MSLPSSRGRLSHRELQSDWASSSMEEREVMLCDETLHKSMSIKNVIKLTTWHD